MRFVGLKGYSRYSDKKAYTLDEINRMEEVTVVLNRVRESEDLERICKALKHEHVVLNEIASIARISREKKVTASVGLNPLNNHDLEFYEELGAYAVVLPPELNEEVESFEKKDVKIEVFRKAFVEMFYKGKCFLSSYLSGKSVKRDGECRMECGKKWEVFYNQKRVGSVTFKPKLIEYDVGGDLLKYEIRQIKGMGVIEHGTDNKHPKP